MRDVAMEVSLEALERVLKMGGPSLLDRLIATGLANLDQRLRELHAAAAAADTENAHRAAHSVKGSSLYLGLNGLAAAAAHVEAATAAQQPGWQTDAMALELAWLETARVELAAARARLVP